MAATWISVPAARLGEADLLKKRFVVVEEELLDDPAVSPLGCSGIKHVERLAGGLDCGPVGLFQRRGEGARETRDEAGEVALAEQDVVGLVLDLVVWES